MATALEINEPLLRRRPLPRPGDGKEERGRLLILAGSTELPGAAFLAGDAALRAGAGKLFVATAPVGIIALGMALPEARIAALPERPRRLLFEERDALVIGPGMDSRAAIRWADTALSHVDLPLLLDAAALEKLWSNPRLRRRRDRGGGNACIVTPNGGELAAMMGRDRQAIMDDPLGAAIEAATRLGVIVVLKAAATTVVATAGTELFFHHARIPGLAVSGSGDVLSGLIGGLLARGAPAVDACLWGVWLHAQAGKRMAARQGGIGYRAAELAKEVPILMDGMR